MYRLIVGRVDGGEERAIDVDRDLALVGRRAGVDVLLPEAGVSPVQLRLERNGAEVTAIDAGAACEITIGGARLAAGGRRTLADGDEIVVAGMFRLRYVARSPAAEATNEAGTAALARAMVRDVLAALGKGSPETAPLLTVIAGPARGATIALPAPGRDVLIGRAESCDAPLVDPDLSREHVRVHRDWTGATITDLGSKNGTKIGGVRLGAEERRLRHGDEIVMGATTVRYSDPTEEYLASITAEPSPEPVAEKVAEPVAVAVAEPVPVRPTDTDTGTDTGTGTGARRAWARIIVAVVLIGAAVAALIALLRA